jgi:hypothetical protein
VVELLKPFEPRLGGLTVRSSVRLLYNNLVLELILVITMFQQLYNEGARVFWIHNVGPIGCLPYNNIYYPHKKGNLDANGCVIPHNELAQEYNRQLKDQVFHLRRKFPLAKFTYVDMYTAKYQLISNAKSQGNDLNLKKHTPFTRIQCFGQGFKLRSGHGDVRVVIFVTAENCAELHLIRPQLHSCCSHKDIKTFVFAARIKFSFNSNA